MFTIKGSSDNVSHSIGVIEKISEGEDGVSTYHVTMSISAAFDTLQEPHYTIRNNNTGKSTTYQVHFSTYSLGRRLMFLSHNFAGKEHRPQDLEYS